MLSSVSHIVVRIIISVFAIETKTIENVINSTLRKLALERDTYLCQYCLANGVVRPNSRIGDHITPAEIAPELRTDLSNIATACRDCDNVKRKLEQEIYGTGQGNTHKNTKLRLSVSQWAGLIARKKRDVREAP